MVTRKYIPVTTTTTTTLTELQAARYRFGGVRYQFQGGSTNGPSWMVPKLDGLYAFPADDNDDG